MILVYFINYQLQCLKQTAISTNLSVYFNMLFEIDSIGERDKNTYIYVALVFPFATRCLPRTVLESPH